MAQQLETLRGGALIPAIAAPAMPASPVPEAFIPAPVLSSAVPTTNEPKAFGPYKPIDKAPGGGLTDRQQAHLDALVTRYTARTPQSKRRTQETRAPSRRSAHGFRVQAAMEGSRLPDHRRTFRRMPFSGHRRQRVR